MRNSTTPTSRSGSPPRLVIGEKIFDVIALVHLAMDRTLYPHAQLSAAEQLGTLTISIPAAALTAARGELKQAAPDRLDQLVDLTPVVVDQLTRRTANRAWDLLAHARPRPAVLDLAAAHVALIGRVRGWPIITDSPDRLLVLDAALEIDPLP